MYEKKYPREIIDGKKYCSKCMRLLPIENFTKCSAIKSGLSSACKECSNKQDKLRIKGFRKCKRCGEFKPLEQYTGIRAVCHDCKKPKPVKIYDCESDRRRAEKHRRKARIKNLQCNFTQKEWLKVQHYFNNRCAYCGTEGRLTQDHFIPLSKGGEYSKNNIVPACHMCNSLKRDLDFFEWYPQQTFYNKQREQKILKYLNYKCGFQQIAM